MDSAIELSEDDFGSRLDIVLARHLSKDHKISRSYCTKLIGSGDVTVNGRASRASYKVKMNDVIEVKDNDKPIEPVDIDIIFKNDDVVVIDKLYGMLSHSKGALNEEFTVADFMKSYFKGTDSNRAGIVHRLDRTTSGVMICARNDEATKHLQKQFSTRNVKKEYIALVEGVLKDDTALLDLPIERNPKRPSTFRAGPNGKTAQTEFEVLKRSNGVTQVKLMPLTGRTHQLRVHMAFIGHPIIGDELYGAKKASRVMLHASKLEITLPDSKRKTFLSPIPKEIDI